MNYSESEILKVLDKCCDSFTFPMLDNGYVYLAETRLTLFRSSEDWGMTIEVFGFSPRSGFPDTHVYTFGSRLSNRKSQEDYVSIEAYNNYLKNNPNNESNFLYPIEEDSWIDEEDNELVSENASALKIRGQRIELPGQEVYSEFGIEFEQSPRLSTFELCRALLVDHKEKMLATDEELRHNVPEELAMILQLEDWHHPDVCGGELPSKSPTFQEIAQVLVTGETSVYTATESSNTHWANWPEGGRL